MTSLAGVWRLDHRGDAGRDCRVMLDAQPMIDGDCGIVWSDGGIGLGRRLTPRLPEDRFDKGPVIGGGGRFALVADLRLDNRDELAAALGRDASDVRDLSDARLLMAMWEKWQAECFGRLLGDYAFALWDSAEQRLFLARDPLGQRPLHYHEGDGFVAFATLAAGLHALSEIPRVVDLRRLEYFLTLQPGAASRTFFEGVTRVDPGGLVEISRSGVRVGRHWDIEARRIAGLPAKDWPEALRDQLDAAIRRRLRGAAHVGAHLSAGLDSGAVAASAALILRDEGRRLTAFTAVPGAGLPDRWPDDRLLDEGPRAAAVAAMYPNIDHVQVTGAPKSLMADLERTSSLAERPPYDLFNHGWIHAVYDAARARKVDVLLTGETGNLTLSYEGLEHLPLMLRQGRPLTWLRTAAALAGASGISWRRLLARSFGPFVPSPIFARLGTRREPEGRRRAAVGPISDRVAAEMALGTQGPSPFPRLWRDPVAMRLWALARRDPGPYNKAALAGWGVELRDPTADLRLLEFCLAVPGEEYLQGGRTRALARRALAGRLPDEVLHERRRGLQGADWAARLTAERDAMAAELDRIAACAPAAALLDLDWARSLLASWPVADREGAMTAATYRFGLVRALSAGHFARTAAGEARPDEPPQSGEAKVPSPGLAGA